MPNRCTYIAQIEDTVHAQTVAANELGTKLEACEWVARKWEWCESQHPGRTYSARILPVMEWIEEAP